MARKAKKKTARQQCKHGKTPKALAATKAVGLVMKSKCGPHSYKVTKQWRLVRAPTASAPASPSGGGYRKKKRKVKGGGWFMRGAML